MFTPCSAVQNYEELALRIGINQASSLIKTIYSLERWSHQALDNKSETAGLGRSSLEDRRVFISGHQDSNFLQNKETSYQRVTFQDWILHEWSLCTFIKRFPWSPVEERREADIVLVFCSWTFTLQAVWSTKLRLEYLGGRPTSFLAAVDEGLGFGCCRGLRSAEEIRMSWMWRMNEWFVWRP